MRWTSSTAPTRPAYAATWARADSGAAIATVTGALPAAPLASASATVRALLSFGITDASIEDHVVVSAGAATATIAAAVTSATVPGRRMAACASRCQRPAAAAAAELRAPQAEQRGRNRERGERRHHRDRRAGDAHRLQEALRNTVSVISAHATVAAEKATVRPAVAIVAPIAAGVAPRAASSSRS